MLGWGVQRATLGSRPQQGCHSGQARVVTSIKVLKAEETEESGPVHLARRRLESLFSDGLGAGETEMLVGVRIQCQAGTAVSESGAPPM